MNANRCQSLHCQSLRYQFVVTIRSVLLSGVVLFGVLGCRGLPEFIEEARVGDSDARVEALLEIEHVIRDADRKDPAAAETRTKIDAFLRERFDAEPDGRLRSQILSLAVQGEFECAEDLLRRGARNPDARLVRILAIQHMRDVGPENFRGTLTAILQTERDPLVLIETIKTITWAKIEPDELDFWVVPIVDVFLDTMGDRNVQSQAHRAAVKLTGAKIPPEDLNGWTEWREKRTP